MGGRDLALQKREVRGAEPIQVDTFGGRLHVEWDTDSSANPIGQLAFFVEFLKNAGVFDDWVGDCPLSYSSPNAPTNRDAEQLLSKDRWELLVRYIVGPDSGFGPGRQTKSSALPAHGAGVTAVFRLIFLNKGHF